jgi:hypothetical protein
MDVSNETSEIFNESYIEENMETVNSRNKYLTLIYICVYVVGLIINVYLSASVMRQNYMKKGLLKIKPANIYALDAFMGDAMLFAFQILFEFLMFVEVYWPTFCQQDVDIMLKYLEFVIPIITLHSIVMYTFLAWERFVSTNTIVEKRYLYCRYCLIFRPTLQKTLKNTRFDAVKRASLIWLMGLIYQLLVALVDYLPITFSTAKILVLALSILQAVIIFILPLCIIVMSYCRTYDLMIHLPISSYITSTNSESNQGQNGGESSLLNIDNIPVRAFNRSRRSFVRHQSAKKVILFAIIFPVFWLPYHVSFIIRTAFYPNIAAEIVYFSHFSFLFANLNFIFCPLLLCLICRNSWT